MNRPLQNRVTPFGEIVAMTARGTMMGIRGGRLHDETKRLTRRRWTSKRWICCELAFKGRWREVMGPGYTHLFFLDEVTALAARLSGLPASLVARAAHVLPCVVVPDDDRFVDIRPRIAPYDLFLPLFDLPFASSLARLFGRQVFTAPAVSL